MIILSVKARNSIRGRSIPPVLVLLVIGFLSISAGATDEEVVGTEYQLPPPEIGELVDAPRRPIISISPDNEWLAIMRRPTLLPLAEVAQPELGLGGIRINPDNNGPSRDRCYNNIALKNIDDLEEREVKGFPADPRIRNVVWSPDGSRIACTNDADDRIELWIIDVDEAEARRLEAVAVNDVYRSPFQWLSDSETLICKTVPPDRGDLPEEPPLPSGPVVQENIGKAAPAVTYSDLLKDPFDEILFEYFLTTQLAKIDASGEISPLGAADLHVTPEPSPDGRYLLVETIHRPFSYLVTARNFPHRVEIWDMDGNVVRQVTDQPLAEDIPVVTGAVRTGPREFGWRADADAVLYWAEALDGGDPRNEAEVRDQIYTLTAPFKGDPIPLFALEYRYGGIRWGTEEFALITSWWWPTRWTRTWIFSPESQRVKPEILFDRSWEDRYNDPGDPVLQSNERGTYTILTDDDGKSIFLRSQGASPEGDRPFLARFNLVSKLTDRIFRSEAPYYEWPIRILDVDGEVLLTSRESVTEPPDYFVRELEDDEIRQITDFPHPTPSLLGIQKEMIRYQREDGIDLTGTLYLPADYDTSQGPLPMLMWAYPAEFRSADAAGQVTSSPYRFVRVGWWEPVIWLSRGYAVLDDPGMPIVGEGDVEPNDTFVEQLVANARAAIDEVVRRGVADRDRIAIGGHSYGAFMTANLLAHSDLFRAGIPRTGAYNRTLTPFGFQNEDRSLWEAPDIYFAMSPFMHADKIDEPILLVHGQKDNNPGTFPMQSERFYNALKGHGATARLVMLPFESHSYRARENVMHVMWETDRWLEEYVKKAPPRAAGESETEDEP